MRNSPSASCPSLANGGYASPIIRSKPSKLHAHSKGRQMKVIRQLSSAHITSRKKEIHRMSHLPYPAEGKKQLAPKILLTRRIFLITR